MPARGAVRHAAWLVVSGSLLVLSPALTSAAPVQVHVRGAAGSALLRARVTISSTHLSTRTFLPEEVIQVEPGTWLVSVSGPHLWAAPISLDVEPSSGAVLEVDVHIWPTGVVKGHLSKSKPSMARDLPTSVQLEWASTPRTGRQSVPSGAVDCPLVSDEWTCEVPAGELDLRLNPRNFSPAYFWDQAVRAEKV